MSVADEIYGSAMMTPKMHHHGSSRNVRQAASYGNLTDNDMTLDFRRATINLDKNGKVKRTKSFWRFSKSEEILEGMAMWKHRDLIPTDQEKRVDDEIREVITTLKRTPKVNKGSHGSRGSKLSVKNDKRMNTLERPSKIRPSPPMQEPSKYLPLTKTEIDERISKQKDIMRGDRDKSMKKQQSSKPERVSGPARSSGNRPYKHDMEREEQIYGDNNSTLQRRPRNESKRNTADKNDKKLWDGSKMKQFYDQQDLPDEPIVPPFDDSEMQDMNFYDDDSLKDIMMKSIKRQDILKQYYSSGTDTERLSTSSDPYDCIVVEDHLVSAADLARKNKKNKKQEDKMEFTTFRSNKTETKDQSMSGSLLPRTKLNKSSESQSKYESGHESNRESQGNKKRSKSSSNNQSKKTSSNYSQWVDLWGNSTSPPTNKK